jgi:hypothetical protein
MAPNLFLLRDAALEQVRRLEVAKAQAYAVEARALAELAGHFQGDSSVFLELSGTARIGQIKAAGSCDRATRLVEGFPVALGLLEQGTMFVGTAELLLAVTKNCSERVRREVDRRLSGQVAALDAADARARISAAVLEIEAELDLAEQQRRYAQARANRGVWVKPVEDGMARIGAEVDAVAAKEFALALEELDRAQKVEDDRCGVVRTKAQRMADVLAELPTRHLALLQAQRAGRVDELLAQALGTAAGTGLSGAGASIGGAPGSGALELPLDLPPAGPPRPWDLELDELVTALLRLPVRPPRTLNVHVAASTTLGLDTRACIVEGLGPLPGWLAPVLLPDATLRRVLVDRTTGLPLHLSDTMPPVLEVDGLLHRRRPDDPPGPRPGPRPGPPHPPDTPPGSPPDTGSDDDRSTDADAAVEAAADAAAAQAWRDRRRLSAVLLGPAVLAGPEPQYAPSTRLRRLVQVRDLRCIGPGCSRAATACDLDHEDEYAHGGATAEWNLSAKSERCHGAKHNGWQVRRDRRTGITTWTSPLGRVYTRQPAWRPPPALPGDVVLGAPAPRTPAQVESRYPHDRPLWPAPKPASAPKPAGKPEPTPGTRTGGLGWDNGTPPPF